jgi:hypothetical protein
MTALNAMYYMFKPFLPVSFRYSMRRLRARYKLACVKDWPIMDRAAQAPAGWRGWPNGKQFAVILTHDVEGQIGLDRSAQLASLEERLGFRSSFNFIPEGEYLVKAGIRDELTAAGFEIGVHDLRHDGSLYRTWQSFRGCAAEINRYLSEWGAVGFRAGFMFHDLEWLKKLNIEYDASTFDTDPFEPQPYGAETIFPFWVDGGLGGGGYVELPYTLPQDSTMFLILQHKAIDLWKRKVDWIAEHGGMVLLNLHPDYIAFDNGPLSLSEFPARFYQELLNYIREKYSGAYWHALPRQIARFFSASRSLRQASAVGTI